MFYAVEIEVDDVRPLAQELDPGWKGATRLPEETGVSRVVVSLLSGATMKIRCTSGSLRAEGEATDSEELVAE